MIQLIHVSRIHKVLDMGSGGMGSHIMHSYLSMISSFVLKVELEEEYDGAGDNQGGHLSRCKGLIMPLTVITRGILCKIVAYSL